MALPRKLIIAAAMLPAAYLVLVLGVGVALRAPTVQRRVSAAITRAASSELGVDLRVKQVSLGPDLDVVLFGLSVAHRGARIEAARAQLRPSLRTLLSGSFGGSLVLSEPATVTVGDVTVTLTEPRATIGQDDDGASFTASAALPDGGRLAAAGRYGRGAVQASLAADGLVLRGSAEGLAAVASVDLGIEVQGDVDEGAANLSLSSRELRLAIDGASLAPLPVSASAVARWEGERLDLDDVQLELGESGELWALLDGEIDGGTDGELALTLSVGSDDLARAVAMMPPELRPPAEATLAGNLQSWIQLAGPTARPGEWLAAGGLDLGAVRSGSFALADAFDYTPEGASRRVHVGPESAAFVPMSQLPTYVLDAITTSEDAGFYRHQGFDFDEIKNSLFEALSIGRIRGGSTITQQLAKNLYLSRERTLGRKLREALVAVGLEATVSKERLLEIYVNAIEWGPDIYGIGEAARAYFGKDARDLTVKEAVYLASIIPSPRPSFARRERGEVSESSGRRLIDLLARMTDRGLLGEDVRVEAEAAPIVFFSN